MSASPVPKSNPTPEFNATNRVNLSLSTGPVIEESKDILTVLNLNPIHLNRNLDKTTKGTPLTLSQTAQHLVNLANQADDKGFPDQRISGDQIDKARLENSMRGVSANISSLIDIKEVTTATAQDALLKELLDLSARRRVLETCKEISEAQFGMRPSAMQVIAGIALSNTLSGGLDSIPAKNTLKYMSLLYANSDHKDLFWVGDPTPYYRMIDFGKDHINVFKQMAFALYNTNWIVPSISTLCRELRLPRSDLSNQVINETLGLFRFLGFITDLPK